MNGYPKGCDIVTSGGALFNYMNHTQVSICPGRQIRFKEPIDPEVMERALEQARKRFPQLSLELRRNEAVYSYAYNPRPYVLLPMKQKFRWMGSPELNRHLISASYSGRNLRLDYLHSLADGNGFLQFVRTVLYYYLTGLGHHIDTQGRVLTNDTIFTPAEAEDPGLALMESKAVPLTRPVHEPAYQIPGPWLDGETPHRFYRVDLDLSRVKGLAKKYDASPVSLVAPLFSKAIYNTYVGPEGDYPHPVRANVAANLRTYFPSPTIRSFANSVSLAYPRLLESRDLEFVLTAQRGALYLQLDPDSLAAGFRDGAPALNKLVNNPNMSVEAKEELVRDQVITPLARESTYMITNIGQVDMPPDILAHLERLETTTPCGYFPLVLSMSSVGPLLNITLIQRLEDRRVLDLFLSYLAELEVPAQASQGPDFYFIKYRGDLAAGE